MDNTFDPIQPSNSRNDLVETPRLQPQQSVRLNYPKPPSTVPPELLRKWYSKSSFRTITFFFFVVTVLGIATSLIFTSKMDINQYLGLVSSLIMLMVPSPLDNNVKLKIKA